MRGQYFVYPLGGSVTIDPTVIDGSANPPSGDAVFDALALKATAPVVQSTAGDYSSNATDVTLSDLTFAASASTKYYLAYTLFIHCPGLQAVIRYKPSYPASYVKTYAGSGGPQSSGSAALSETPANATQVGQYISTQAGDFTIGHFWVFVQTGASAGNISLAFNSPTGVGLVKAGSFVEVKIIP